MKLKEKLKISYRFLKTQYNKLMHGCCAILLYHRVEDLETDPQLLAVSRENFDKQIAYLSENYNLLTIEQFENILINKKRFPKKSVLITFDDGYADNYLNAMSILEKHKVQALFYITTNTLNTTSEYWWDAVERIILLSNTPNQLFFELNEVKYDLTNFNGHERQAFYKIMLAELKQLKPLKRDETIAKLAQIFNMPEARKTHRAMTFEELKKMNQSQSAIIGAHTHMHSPLSILTKQEQYDEVKLSKDILEQLLQKKITHFSYPFGTRSDFNKESLEVVAELGFDFVTANYPNLVTRNSNRYELNRVVVRNWNISDFKKQLKNFFSIAKQIIIHLFFYTFNSEFLFFINC